MTTRILFSRSLLFSLLVASLAHAAMHKKKKAVFVLGAPRSGTSVTTGVLGELGLPLGAKLTDPQSWNPKGDFEDEATVELNKRLIRNFGIDPRNANAQEPINWHKDQRVGPAKELIKEQIFKGSFNQAPLFGLKHPRVCLLLPAYLQAAEEMGYDPHLIIVSRDPKDVVKSLNKSEKQRGDEYSHDEGIRFVNNFLRPIGQYAGDYPHVRVTFKEMTEDTPRAIEKIRKMLPELDPFEQHKENLKLFVTPPSEKKVAVKIA